MKIINLHIPVMLRKELDKESRSFNMEEVCNQVGWGCVANLGIDTGVMKIAFMNPREFNAFQRAYNKEIKKVMKELPCQTK